MTFPLPGSSAPRILIIDDDVAVTDTVSRMLRLDGYEVWGAFSASEGLNLARKHRPHAILLDLRMPLSGAVRLLRAVRDVQGLDTVPVVIISGDYQFGEQHAAEVLALGAELRYKPLWLGELVALARDLLRVPVRD